MQVRENSTTSSLLIDSVVFWLIISLVYLCIKIPEAFYIVAPFEVCRLMILPHNVKCIDEDKWITGLNLQSFQDYFGQTLPTLVQKRDLWFWQQILKACNGFTA
eukprot:UN07207